MLFKKSVMTAAVFAVGSFAVMSANAADSGEFGVTMTLTATCSVDTSAISLAFADQSAATTTNTTLATSTGDIAVICSKDAPYKISLASSNVTNTSGIGQMIHAEGVGVDSQNTISYQLYSNLEGTTPWGSDATVGTGNIVGGTGAGLTAGARTHKVYAKMSSPTDILLGEYSDTVTASITY